MNNTKIVQTSFELLYPGKEWKYEEKTRYSGRFKGFNASITRRSNNITVSLSKEWKTVDNDIKIGLVQELLGKLFKEKKITFNIEVYHAFLKKVGQYMPKKDPEEALKESFNRMNKEYFNEIMERPNINWCNGKNRVGYYEYGTDTVSLSRELAQDTELLDYVMYHELLHKKHKFKTSTKRTRHHSKEFKEEEHKYKNWQTQEKKLERLARRNKWRLY
ncbi:M48 family metallopeptidase [Candidatus Woesearchaeota archaeon]|nr:M48 family metallopeptidase [Candidatus Woesearchaeota archaeon]